MKIKNKVNKMYESSPSQLLLHRFKLFIRDKYKIPKNTN